MSRPRRCPRCGGLDRGAGIVHDPTCPDGGRRDLALSGVALRLNTSYARFEARKYASPVPDISAHVRAQMVGGGWQEIASLSDLDTAEAVADSLNRCLALLREAEQIIALDRKDRAEARSRS